MRSILSTYEAALKGAEALKASAEAAQKLAKAEYDRTRVLIPKGGASAFDFDSWAAKLAVATADIQKADAGLDQAKLDLEFAKVTAPISGKIKQAARHRRGTW